jgi:PKD repeat protein
MRRLAVLAAALLWLSGATPTIAEEVIEAYRSPFGTVRSVSVNPTDGSCWVAAGGSVMHVAADGTILGQHGGFSRPIAVTVNPTDGSCWVADWGSGEVVHLSAEGVALWRGGGFAGPRDISVNSTDGSCWAVDVLGGEVVHLSEAGMELWRGGGFGWPLCVSVNPADGSCWVADDGNGQVVHLSAEGVELWRGGGFSGPRGVSVNPADGSCWVADKWNDEVVHLSAEGVELWRGGGFDRPSDVSANWADGSCWVADSENHQVVHLSAEGMELWRGGGFDDPTDISVDPTDGSCWVADDGNDQVVHLSAEGVELWRGGGLGRPSDVSVNRTDGSCWVAHGTADQVVHLSAEGAELWRGGGFDRPSAVSVNWNDGSCWVADTENSQVVHLSAEGMELSRAGPYTYSNFEALSVNWNDGSCWVASLILGRVLHLSAEGVELWRGGEFDDPTGISVDPTDGSCWVADYGTDEVVHLSEAGIELWRGGGFNSPYGVSVNPTDGSCWVADRGHHEVVHLSKSGTELWRGGGFYYPRSVSVNPADGSCWVADSGNDEVVHLSAEGVELWRGRSFDYPGDVCVDPGDGSCWVADTHNRQVVHLVVVPDVGPAAAFTAIPTGGAAPLTVEFIDFSTRGVASWSWDCGDGGTSAEQHPVHTYTAFGSYPVTLTVADADGSDTETKLDYITVGPLPAADFVGDPTIGAAPLTVNFSDLTTGGVTFWYWEFGDGGTSTEQHPSHEYAEPGVYTVSLSIWGLTGYDTLTKTDYISVQALPLIGVACWPPRGTAPLTVEFRDMSSGGAVSWQWDFGDGSVSTQQNPTHVYAEPGKYTVSLTATSEWGSSTLVCEDLITVAFIDAPFEHWACDEVLACVSAGIVVGYPDGLYRPDWEITRDQMAVYIARALVVPSGEAAVAEYVAADPQNFPDVPADNWAYTHVEYCAENGVVEGYEDGLYHPGYEVTRDQMAVYVARAIATPTGEAGLEDYLPRYPRNFPDVASDSWAYTHVEYCVENGVVAGYLDGLYHPEIVVTRDQMAVYVARAFRLAM